MHTIYSALHILRVLGNIAHATPRPQVYRHGMSYSIIGEMQPSVPAEAGKIITMQSGKSQTDLSKWIYP